MARDEREPERQRLKALAEEANQPPGPPDLATAGPAHPGREAARTLRRRGR